MENHARLKVTDLIALANGEVPAPLKARKPKGGRRRAEKLTLLMGWKDLRGKPLKYQQVKIGQGGGVKKIEVYRKTYYTPSLLKELGLIHMRNYDNEGDFEGCDIFLGDSKDDILINIFIDDAKNKCTFWEYADSITHTGNQLRFYLFTRKKPLSVSDSDKSQPRKKRAIDTNSLPNHPSLLQVYPTPVILEGKGKQISVNSGGTLSSMPIEHPSPLRSLSLTTIHHSGDPFLVQNIEKSISNHEFQFQKPSQPSNSLFSTQHSRMGTGHFSRREPSSSSCAYESGIHEPSRLQAATPQKVISLSSTQHSRRVHDPGHTPRSEQANSGLRYTASKYQITINIDGEDVELSIPIIERGDLIMTDEILGRGAFGKVRKGSRRDTKIAIKISLSENTKYIVREIDVLQNIRHPNVIGIYGELFDHQSVSIGLEYFQSQSLRSLLFHNQARYFLTLEQKNAIALTMCGVCHFYIRRKLCTKISSRRISWLMITARPNCATRNSADPSKCQVA